MNIFKYILSCLLIIGFASVLSVSPISAQEKSKSEQESKQDEQKKDSKDKSKSEGAEESSDEDESGEKDQPKDQEKDQEKEEKQSEDMDPDQEDGSDDSDDNKSDEEDSDDDESDQDEEEEEAEPESVEETVTEKISRLTRGGAQGYSKKSETFVQVFNPVVSSVNDSTLQIMSGRRQIGLGTVVDANGYILTKASELRGELGCKLGNGKIVKAVVHGVDSETDLALLKIEAENLSEAPWSDSTAPAIGQWLASPMADKGAPVIGVVSVNSRPIPPSEVFVGIRMVNLENGEPGVLLVDIVRRTPAAYAGLKEDDIILKIDKQEVTDRIKFKEILENYDVNDRIALSVKRDDKVKTIKLTLAAKDQVSPDNQRSNTQNNMGSTLSKRRKKFPIAFQHDSGLNSNTCGGPIVDLSGKIVGINIARSGRVSSLALPVEIVRPIISMLKTGEYAPAIVNRDAIQAIDQELEELVSKLGSLPSKKSVLDNRYQREKGRVEELERSIKEMQARLKSIKAAAIEKKKELDVVRRELFNIEKTRKRLESDRRQLATGSR